MADAETATAPTQHQRQAQAGPSVEMDNLAAAALTAAPPALEPTQGQDKDTTAGAQQTDGTAETSAIAAAAASSSLPPPPAAEDPSTFQPHRDPLTRTETEALGPATESPIAVPAAGNALSITLMLTTGARHPYKIDEKYLRNRKVDVANADPRELSGYKLKELVWTDWRTEWEPRPASPSSIRLIILGRLIEDKASLKDLPFKTDDTNVVHMTVKPADFIDEEETMGKGTGKGHSIRGRDDGEGGAGCRCVIL